MTSISNEAVLLRHDADGVATLTLNRGAKFNALSSELMAAVQDQLDAIAEDPSVRVVVLTGAGKAFCAGHDLSEMRADPGPEAMNALFSQCSRMMLTLTRIPQPVIARVHGMATAAGCQLVAQCDLAIAVEEATFATSGINVGLFCSTPMVAVTRNLPRKQAMEMLMTGEFIDAATARDYGLVNRVVPAAELDAAVAAMAATLAGKSPKALARGKQLFYSQLEVGLEGAYEQATRVITDNMQDHDTRAGIDAFVGKKPMPGWSDR
jgi:enoyl-CoA hydratase/carnithine racemase